MPALLRRPLFWLAVLAVLAAGSLGGALALSAKGRAAHAATKAAAAAVDTPYAAIAAGEADVEGGLIQVAARAPGVVREVDVKEGDRVKRGQILARQEDDQARLAALTARADLGQARAQVAAINVQIATANREYDRLAKLAAQNWVAKQQLDQAGDAVRTAEAQLGMQEAAIGAAAARVAQAEYDEELTIIRAPADGVIVRRYANPGAGASTLNVSTMFDLEPDTPHIVRAEVAESAIGLVRLGETVELSPETDQSHVYLGQVLRRSGVFGVRKLISDDPSQATDTRVVEVVVSADKAPFLVGQRVLVKFMRPGKVAGANGDERGS
jgi:HlyD family secretion protein